MAIKQGLIERALRGLRAHLGDLTGSFKTSFTVLGGLTLASCMLVPLLDREEPSLRA